MEKELYEKWFGIELKKIDKVLWAVNPPVIDKNSKPIIDEAYITAIGGTARDYPTVMAAMAMLPEITLVAVMRPDNLQDLVVPENVIIKTNIEREDADNILAHARFMVLPLAGTEIPCGHVTIVAAMYVGIPLIVTNSTGIDDYIEKNETAIITEALNPKELADAIKILWGDEYKQKMLSDNGVSFVKDNCSESVMVNHFKKYVSLNFNL